MKRKLIKLAHRYQATLRTYLKAGPKASLGGARGLGVGLQTLDLAKLHEEVLVAEVFLGCRARKRAAVIKQAGIFFAVAITPLEKSNESAWNTTAHLKKFIETLSQRTVDLAASNLELRLEITQRKAVEEKLKRSERHYTKLLRRSNSLQEQLRRLSRQILSAQEDERKKISRELHDVIGQTLTSINVRLAALKRGAALNTKDLDRNIARTQQLVERSVNIVHQFARELRPTVLDDLGLIPALHAFLKNFRQQTGVRVSLSTFAAVEDMKGDNRTVLYRVAQEALTNIARHAHASEAKITIQKLNGAVRMKVGDNGKGFRIADVSNGGVDKRLGLLGMRERLEMVGGKFAVTSTPGKGTLVMVEIPLTDRPRPGASFH